jgi:molecular chaperone GrpE
MEREDQFKSQDSDLSTVMDEGETEVVLENEEERESCQEPDGDVSTDSHEIKDSLDNLKEQLLVATEKSAENWDKFLRLKSDMENLKRRTEREVSNAHKFGLEKFISNLLPVMDSMEMGILAAQEDSAEVDSLREGVELTLKMVMDVVNKSGVEIVDPQGEKFDPQKHEAMGMQEVADVDPNTVTLVIQKGYSLNERLLRPARVMVSKAPAE